MAVTNEELARVRAELEMKINSVSVEHVHLVQALGSYTERFTAVDVQLEALSLRMDALSAERDRRFGDVDRRFDALSADMDRRFDAVSADMDRRFADVRSDIARLDSRIDRLDSKLDARFNVQTVLMTVLGILVLFGDPIRGALGL